MAVANSLALQCDVRANVALGRGDVALGGGEALVHGARDVFELLALDVTQAPREGVRAGQLLELRVERLERAAGLDIEVADRLLIELHVRDRLEADPGE